MVMTPFRDVKKTMDDTSGCCSSLSFSTGLMLSASLAYKICKLNKMFGDLSNTKDRVTPQFKSPGREFKIRRATESFDEHRDACKRRQTLS